MPPDDLWTVAPAMDEMHPFTVIIPAHNEEAVIERCLRRILEGAPAGAMEIIVAANGCTDRTVDIARAVSADVLVLDLPNGSKTAAINAANNVATHFPRMYVDADVECGFASLSALARQLREPGVMTAAPSIRMDLGRCNLFMRAYYRAWSRQPYAKAGKGGAGVYGVSQAALTTVGAFPPIIGDDIWIHTRFPDEQKRYIAQDDKGREIFSTVYPPRTACEQIKVEARRHNGTAEVRRLFPSAYSANANNGGGWKAALTSGTNVFDLAIFLAIKFVARALAHWNQKRGKATAWARDMSTRQAS